MSFCVQGLQLFKKPKNQISFHGHFKGHCLLIQSDNETCVQVINSRRSRSPLLQQCLRILWLICATRDLDLQAEHIPGFLNPYADLLSQWSSDPSAQDKFFALPGTHKLQAIFCKSHPTCDSRVFRISSYFN